ncbi:MOSC domain-containing protein [Ditylenchus destructor]|uniref:MOSC domain-containing protein n=1 Tax=Ditylenchus destructor TaxID=166010 RepID=A0AAD4NFR6_9BILA|nr:MOSC domain-containing protein [Ditylenchus destructor]
MPVTQRQYFPWWRIETTNELHRNERTDGYDCGDKVGQFLTEALEVQGKRELRLLYFIDGVYTERNFPTDPVWWNNPVPKLTEQIAYADLAAYHAFTTASVDDLNSRLEKKGVKKISQLNFRPTIVMSGIDRPYDEDRWLHVRVGDEVEFVCYKPCTRCVLTTVDPENGKKSEVMEPLKELRNYRLAPEGKMHDEFKDSPIFGVNMALIKGGRIRVGDDVSIRYKPTPY